MARSTRKAAHLNVSAAFAPVIAYMLGGWEIIVVGGLVLLLFFGKRIPQAMRSLGSGVSQFKRGLKDDDDDEDGGEDDKKLSPPAKGDE